MGAGWGVACVAGMRLAAFWEETPAEKRIREAADKKLAKEKERARGQSKKAAIATISKLSPVIALAAGIFAGELAGSLPQEVAGPLRDAMAELEQLVARCRSCIADGGTTEVASDAASAVAPATSRVKKLAKIAETIMRRVHRNTHTPITKQIYTYIALRHTMQANEN